MATPYTSSVKVNPSSPVLLIKCGDLDLTLQNKPEQAEYVMAFSMVRSDDETAQDIVMQLFDQSAFLLEWALIQGNTSIKFQFGQDYTNMSRIYTGCIKDYSLEFVGMNTILTVNLVLGGGTETSEESQTYTGSPSDIVKQIAKEEGWEIGKVTASKKIEGKSYNRTGQTAVDFIKNTLAKEAQTVDGKTGFVFYTESTDKGKTVVNFRLGEEAGASDIKVYEIVVNGGSNNRADDAENVISFQPTYDGLLHNLMGSSANPNSDTPLTESVNNGTETKPIVPNLDVQVPTLDDLTNELVPPSKKEGITRIVGSSSYNNEEMGRIAEHLFKKAVEFTNTAQLVLRGDASVSILSMVAIVVLTPDGHFHHSSGLYQVLEISDDIEGALYTTTLNLVRRAMRIGADGKIELITSEEDLKLPVSTGSSSQQGQQTNQSGGGMVGDLVSEAKLRELIQPVLGRPYLWGGVGASRYDCSGFTGWIMKQLGVNQPRTTSELMRMGEDYAPYVIRPGEKWDLSKLQPGDQIVYNKGGGGHTLLVINQNTVCHSPSTGDVIKYSDIKWCADSYPAKGGCVYRPLAGKRKDGIGNPIFKP